MSDSSTSFEPISFEEYEQAYRAFVACLNETGVGIQELGFDETNQVFMYVTEVGDSEKFNQAGRLPADKCYVSMFEDADTRWQGQLSLAKFPAQRERILAVFAEQGLVDIPKEVLESKSIGQVVMFGREKLGPSVLTEIASRLEA